GTTTKPWGFVDLIVTVGANEMAKSIKVQFWVVDYPSHISASSAGQPLQICSLCLPLPF
ncbi:hypothetical protein A2U01_0094565, partial [Trifolium medium]|nr:hypothetical protein [Trifolium medium]